MSELDTVRRLLLAANLDEEPGLMSQDVTAALAMRALRTIERLRAEKEAAEQKLQRVLDREGL
jgi:hypothetical protein